jgi:cytoskeletal protein RodZ
MDDLLQQIMPILIFGAWIIISIYTANQKRKKKQQMQQRQYEMKQQQPNHEPVYSGDTSPQSQSDDLGTDLKRTLENIFGEPVEQTPLPHTQHDAEPVYQDDIKVEPDHSAESQTLQEQAAIQEQYTALMQRGDSIVSIDSTQKQPLPSEPEFAESVSFTRSELRNGILWAEILGKPVSMRT